MPVTIVSRKMGRAGPKGRSAMRIQRAFRRSGLNKTEKKQVDSKIKSAIRKTNSLKYFNSQSSDNAVAPLPSTVSNKQEISVIAFSSTTEFDDAGVALKYGPQEYQPLYLARPFKANNPNEALAEQALDGQFCLPKSAVTRFSIERVAYQIADRFGGTLPNPDPLLARTLPISYRIIKIGIKAMKGTQNVINPNLDLFLDSFGQPTGIDQDDFDRLDCRYSPINTRKYVKLMDRYGTINQDNIVTPTLTLDPGVTWHNSDIITGKNGRSTVHMTVPFKLSARKNGKLFYNTPQQAGTEPTSFNSGGAREILLIHTWFDNGHNLLGGEGQPQCPTADDLQIKTKSKSAFIDTN